MHPHIHFVYEKKGRALSLPCFEVPTHKGGRVFAQVPRAHVTDTEKQGRPKDPTLPSLVQKPG
jgi:hypothetical protein